MEFFIQIFEFITKTTDLSPKPRSLSVKLVNLSQKPWICQLSQGVVIQTWKLLPKPRSLSFKFWSILNCELRFTPFLA